MCMTLTTAKESGLSPINLSPTDQTHPAPTMCKYLLDAGGSGGAEPEAIVHASSRNQKKITHMHMCLGTQQGTCDSPVKRVKFTLERLGDRLERARVGEKAPSKEIRGHELQEQGKRSQSSTYSAGGDEN